MWCRSGAIIDKKIFPIFNNEYRDFYAFSYLTRLTRQLITTGLFLLWLPLKQVNASPAPFLLPHAFSVNDTRNAGRRIHREAVKHQTRKPYSFTKHSHWRLLTYK